jgi:hypothetical protein
MKRFLSAVIVLCACVVAQAEIVSAQNVTFFSDTISTSAPGQNANHTFTFTLTEAIAPGGALTFTWPSDFTLSTSTVQFAERNVELLVNGTPRTATTTASAVADGVSLVRGAVEV